MQSQSSNLSVPINGINSPAPYLTVGFPGTGPTGLQTFTFLYSDVFDVSNIQPGTILTFTFNPNYFSGALNGNFGISGCSSDGSTPGIYDTNFNNLGLPCTNLSDSSKGTEFYTETDGTNQITLAFHCPPTSVDPNCSTFPQAYSGFNIAGTSQTFDWGFTVSDDQTGAGKYLPTAVTETQSVPEPATATLLMAGLLSAGFIRRRKTAV